MTSIDRVTGGTFVSGTEMTEGAAFGRTGEAGGDTPAASRTGRSIAADLDLPELPLALRGISIENLMSAISDEMRKSGVRSAVDALEKQGDEMAETNAKQLEEIAKQIKSVKKESFWDKFCKVFKIIGAVIGIVASVATIAVSAVTNPLMVAGGVLGLIMSIDGIVSAATDGKASIAAGFSKLGEVCGLDPQNSVCVGFAANMLFTIAGTALTFGASTVASASKAASDAALNICTKAATLASVAQGAAGVVGAGGEVGRSIAHYETEMSRARSVDIDAILEALREAMQTNKKFIEHEMATSAQLMEAVRDIVADCGAASNAILTVSAAPA